MYDAWKKKVMPDTTRIYYIDTWFLSQNLPYYRPETLTSFILRVTRAKEVKGPSRSVANHLLDLIFKSLDPWFWPGYWPGEGGGGHAWEWQVWEGTMMVGASTKSNIFILPLSWAAAGSSRRRGLWRLGSTAWIGRHTIRKRRCKLE